MSLSRKEDAGAFRRMQKQSVIKSPKALNQKLENWELEEAIFSIFSISEISWSPIFTPSVFELLFSLGRSESRSDFPTSLRKVGEDSPTIHLPLVLASEEGKVYSENRFPAAIGWVAEEEQPGVKVSSVNR